MDLKSMIEKCLTCATNVEEVLSEQSARRLYIDEKEACFLRERGVQVFYYDTRVGDYRCRKYFIMVTLGDLIKKSR